MRSELGGWVCALGVIGALGAVSASGQCERSEDQRVVTNNGEFLDGFGRSVSIDGDLAVATADGEDGMGAAYTYQRVGEAWAPLERVVPIDHEPLDLFGRVAVVQGTTMFVGNPWDDESATNSGSVNVFELVGSTWVEGDEIAPTDGVEFGQFGWALAVDGDVLVVGAIGDEPDATPDPGAVYVYRDGGAGWAFEQKLTVSPAGDLDQFGFTVALDGDVLAATAINDDDAGVDAGAVYIFRYDGATWQEEEKLTARDTSGGDFFGWSLALEDDLLAVGAAQHDLPQTNGGALYLFEWDGAAWNETGKIAPDDVAPFESFGWSVALEGDRVVVGAVGADDNGGGVYLFQNTGAEWVESYLWTGSGAPGNGFFGDNLGLSVAMDGDRVLGGAPFAAGVSEEDAGAAYAYDISDLAVDAVPGVVQAGDDLTLRACGGAPGEGVRLSLRSINGDPTNLQVGSGVFDAAGRFEALVPIPDTVGGNQAGFIARGFRQPGVLGTSDEVIVNIQP